MPADVAVPRPRPADQDRFRAAVADALDRIADEQVRDAFLADAGAWLERAL